MSVIEIFQQLIESAAILGNAAAVVEPMSVIAVTADSLLLKHNATRAFTPKGGA